MAGSPQESFKAFEIDSSLEEFKKALENEKRDEFTHLLISNKTGILDWNIEMFGEHFPKLKRLAMNKNTIEKISGRAFDNLETLKYLELTQNKLQAIEPYAFAGLCSLYSLDLSGNNIETIDDNCFDGLKCLGNLILSDNRINSLSENCFKDLNGLFNLDISNNQIKELPTGIFNGLTNLGHISFRKNGISDLSGEIFSQLQNLYNLDFSENKLTKLQNGLLEGKVIKGAHLTFSDNLIEDIEETALKGMKISSGILDLSKNQIKTLKRLTFHQVEAKDIFLYNNQIDCIENGAFNECLCEFLRLDNNLLSNVKYEMFEGLTIKCVFYLSKNKIETYAGAFKGLPELVRLHLDKNCISELPNNGFQGAKNLAILLLNGNAIKMVERDSFFELTELVDLHLHENNIESLHPQCFRTTKSLVYLLLLSNQISSLDSELFQNTPKIESVYMTNNNFTALPPNSLYKGLKNLRTIYFDYNKIETVPENSFGTEQDKMCLQLLTLHHNNIHSIEPGAFRGILYTRYLILSSNNIESFDEKAFDGLGSVFRLELEKTPLASVDVLDFCPKTQIIVLAHSKIGSENLQLDHLKLNGVTYVTFDKCSYQRVDGKWILLETTVEDMEEEFVWDEFLPEEASS